MRTRSTRTSESASKPTATTESSTKPSKTFILPTAASNDADSRLLTLPNPRTGSLNRYLFSPKLGLYEFTVVAPPPRQPPRSILFAPKSTDAASEENKKGSPGAISRSAELWVATPVDFLFFMIPLLVPSEPTRNSDNAKGLFQPLDDIIDSQDNLHAHMRYVLCVETFQDVYRQRVEAVCDTVEAGDEKMFRFNEKKLLQDLIRKAEQMTAQGLPASLEEKFVRQALVTPLMAVKREDLVTDKNGHGQSHSNENEKGESQAEKLVSQSSTATATTTPSLSTPSGESPATEPSVTDSPDTEDTKPESTQTDRGENTGTPEPIVRLLRLSTALSFIQQSYLPPSLSTRIDEILSSPESPIDFTPMNEHLKRVATLRAEALAARSLADFSRKRTAEDEEEAESRADKKRRKEEEEKKKKAGESRAVRELKKVDTSGMKKMSDFFGKAASKKKT